MKLVTLGGTTKFELSPSKNLFRVVLQSTHQVLFTSSTKKACLAWHADKLRANASYVNDLMLVPPGTISGVPLVG